MKWFSKMAFEVEAEDGEQPLEEVTIYEFRPVKWFIVGLFVWPRSWEWTLGLFPDLYRKGGYVMHLGPVSIALMVGQPE